MARNFWRHLSHEMFRLPLVPVELSTNVKFTNFQPKELPQIIPQPVINLKKQPHDQNHQHQPSKKKLIKNPSSNPAPSHPKPPIPRRWSRRDVAPAVRPHPAARSQPGPRQPGEDLQTPAVGPAVVAYSSGWLGKTWEKRGKIMGKSWENHGNSRKIPFWGEKPIFWGEMFFWKWFLDVFELD